MKLTAKPALMIIDVQEGIEDEAHWGGNRNNLHAEDNIEILLGHWRKQKLPVIIVQHCSVSVTSPFRQDHVGNKLMDFVSVQPGEKLIQKFTASAFIKTDLLDHIDSQKISSLVITGFVTNNSIEATARNAGDLGIYTIVVSDATACFDKVGLDGTKYASDVVHQLSLANLKDEYANIKTTQEVLPSLNLPYNIPDFFPVHGTGNPKCTLPQRRRDAKFRRVALRNFAALRLRGERGFLKVLEWTIYQWQKTWLRGSMLLFYQILCKRRGLKFKISKSKIE